jgi:transcriptional regulator with XRE-family HTH domain
LTNDLLEKRREPTPLPRFYLIDQRIKLGLSVEQVSRALEISNFYYYQIESGRRGLKLTVPMSLKIIKALKLDAMKFLNCEAEHAMKYKAMNQE